ncbi:MAG: glycosyltransferase [Acidimicrobiales bacterium]
MKPGLAITTATAMTIKAFMIEHIRAALPYFDVTVFAADPDRYDLPELLPKVEFVHVDINRSGLGMPDAVMLARLTREFRRRDFTIVHSVTPKAGLLAMSAARITRTPHRIHTFTGQVWADKTGLRRSVLKLADRTIATLATDVLVDGHPQQRFLVDNGILKLGRSSVLGDGSISGVDLSRFRPDPVARAAIRSQYGIAHDDVVFLYLGRMRDDKGTPELVEAFTRVALKNRSYKLLLVGHAEDGFEASKSGGPHPQIITVDEFVSDAERYLATADVFCLPSHREGFGTVIIEAAACGLPSIVSDIFGLSDTVLEGVTGVVVPLGNTQQLAAAMMALADDTERRSEMGARARSRAIDHFSATMLSRLLVSYYCNLANIEMDPSVS